MFKKIPFALVLLSSLVLYGQDDPRLMENGVQAWISEFDQTADPKLRGHGRDVMVEFWTLIEPYDETSMTAEVRAEMERRARIQAIEIVRLRLLQDQTSAAVPTVSYIEIPIVGGIGTDVRGEWVARAIADAQRRGIEHVVLYIDTFGGVVTDGIEMRDAMLDAEGIRFHALVKRAISAGIVPVFAAHDITVMDGATIGAAVAYSGTTGEIEVDAKFNSAFTAEVASAAEMRGYPTSIVRGMMLMEASCYAWRQADGSCLISEDRPSVEGALLVHDTSTTILTLTAEQAIALGIARRGTSTADALDLDEAAVTLEESRPTGRDLLTRFAELDERRMRAERHRALRHEAEDAAEQADSEKLARKRPALVEFIRSNTREAERNDPENFTYSYTVDNGLFTWEALKQWRANTDRAVAGWRRVQAGVKELVEAEEAAVELGLEPYKHEINLQDTWNRAGREIDRLLQNRDRRRI